ncbi:MAG: PAS domain-containing protein, partial [Persicimonas sp.]
MSNQPVDEPAFVDFQKLFEVTPERYVLIGADAPRYTLLAASDAYLDLVMLGRQEVIGRGLFELFPDDGGEPTSNEQFLMRGALEKVLREGKPHSLAAYRYDLPDPGAPDQTFERYWSPSLLPLINDDGEVNSILLRIEEATDFVMRERYIHAQRSGQESSEDDRRTVLLVEPDEGWRAHLASAFATHWEVESVATGAEAFDVLERFSPEVVVAATRLPDRCGLSFISDVKEATTIPILARVDQTDGRRYRAAFEAGADDVIGGPVSAREFMARVQTQFAEAALREATHERIRRQYEQLFMQAPVAISLLEGPDHVYTLNNPALFDLIGDRPLLGLPVREAFPEPGMQPIFDRLDEVYETGERFFATEVPLELDNEKGRRYVTFAYLPYRDPDGVTQGVAAFAYDVTEQVEMRMAVERENERKDIFLAMLGHELRNPLAPIAHAAELLQLEADAPEPDRVGWASDLILRQIDQLKHHVDDLLDIARINQGRIIID